MGLDFGRWQIRNFRADDTEDLARYANIPTCSATCATLSRIRTPCETPRSKSATEAIVSGNGFRYSDRNLRFWLEREEIPHIMDIKSSERLWTLTDRRLLQVRADRLASGVADPVGSGAAPGTAPRDHGSTIGSPWILALKGGC